MPQRQAKPRNVSRQFSAESRRMTIMKKYLPIYFLLLNLCCFSQTSKKDFIQLAEAFHKYSSIRNVDSLVILNLGKIQSVENDNSRDFIVEIIKPNNQTLSDKYLTKPTLKTLKSVYVILQLNYNMFSSKPIANEKVIKKIDFKNISEDELLVTYYRTLIGNLVNKLETIDFSIVNFDFEKLKLKTKTEKSIFFLIVMERLGSYYWANEAMSESINRDDIVNIIKRYPKFDGKKYFEYNDFDFQDFNVSVDIRRAKESFKDYYLKNYINIIQYHFEELKTKLKTE